MVNRGVGAYFRMGCLFKDIQYLFTWKAMSTIQLISIAEHIKLDINLGSEYFLHLQLMRNPLRQKIMLIFKFDSVMNIEWWYLKFDVAFYLIIWSCNIFLYFNSWYDIIWPIKLNTLPPTIKAYITI